MVYFICSDSTLIDIEATLSFKDILIISNLIIEIMSTNCFSWRASRSDINFVKLFNNYINNKFPEIKKIRLSKHDKEKISEIQKSAEEELNKSDINDQEKYLLDQKLEVLKSIN